MEITQNHKIALALSILKPKAIWTLEGDNYDDIKWLDAKQTQPTLEELEAEIANPTPQAEATVADKLAAAGLTVDELKAALGL